MAKNHGVTGAETAHETALGGRKPWLSKRTGAVVMGLLTVAVFVVVWLSAPPEADWRTSLKVAVVMAGAMWVVFAFVLTLSRWLRSR